jgi:hypothetical protein
MDEHEDEIAHFECYQEEKNKGIATQISNSPLTGVKATGQKDRAARQVLPWPAAKPRTKTDL